MTQTIYEQLEAIFNDVPSLTVIGGSWGDEGKGKVIDLIIKYFDAAVRFSGGANAGHTVYTDDGQKIVSHLIPCGLAQQKICILGRGEFFNAELFLKELAEARITLGMTSLAPIYIDEQSTLWTPYHRLLEAYIEGSLGNKKIGTTAKGIGPLEGLYKLHIAPVVGHLLHPELLLTVLTSLHAILKPLFDHATAQGLFTEAIPTPLAVQQQLLSYAPALQPFMTDTSLLLSQMSRDGKRLLFEGAQATGLDAWWGTYPFISSGNSTAAGAALGTGLPSANSAMVIMVVKILPTRVGAGPFPSELWNRDDAMDFAKTHGELFTKGQVRDTFLLSMKEKINSRNANRAELAQYFQVLGDERGATTGRGRSIGLPDIPWLQYAARINAPRYIALTRFDMLSGIHTIPMVTGYKLDGKLLAPGQIPPAFRMHELETVIEEWPGFSEHINGMSSFDALPQNAQQFIARLERLMGVPILFIGTGHERESMIVHQH